MSTQKKTCPKCSSVMDYRLGVYDCPQCGHHEAKQIEIDPRERRASGPGFKREQPWDKAQSDLLARLGLTLPRRLAPPRWVAQM